MRLENLPVDVLIKCQMHEWINHAKKVKKGCIVKIWYQNKQSSNGANGKDKK